MKKPIRVFFILAKMFLNAFSVVTSTASAGSLFHLFTTLFEKKWWRKSVLLWCFFNLNEWTLVLNLSPEWKVTPAGLTTDHDSSWKLPIDQHGSFSLQATRVTNIAAWTHNWWLSEYWKTEWIDAGRALVFPCPSCRMATRLGNSTQGEDGQVSCTSLLATVALCLI